LGKERDRESKRIEQKGMEHHINSDHDHETTTTKTRLSKNKQRDNYESRAPCAAG